jgi:hypothetical protein
LKQSLKNGGFEVQKPCDTMSRMHRRSQNEVTNFLGIQPSLFSTPQNVKEALKIQKKTTID